LASEQPGERRRLRRKLEFARRLDRVGKVHSTELVAYSSLAEPGDKGVAGRFPRHEGTDEDA
jgi:hypothetical protein